MRAPTEREIENFRKWKDNPTPKWKFIVIYGSLLWGTIAGSLAYFITLSMSGGAFDLAQFITRVIVFMIVGLLFGYFMYRGKIKRFEQIKDQL